MQLLLNPSTLAPLAAAMKLCTDGEKRPIKASLHAPKRIVPAATHADIELTQLLYYFIGSLHRSLPKTASATSSTSTLLKKYVINLLKSGLPHTTPAKLLIRASELSGQAVIGIKKGHARAELRVAQLCIWGERRSKKLKKLIPDQKCHRKALNIRKAELLKQRWKDEEVKMVQWRRRMVSLTFFFSLAFFGLQLGRIKNSVTISLFNSLKLLLLKKLMPKHKGFSVLLGLKKLLNGENLEKWKQSNRLVQDCFPSCLVFGRKQIEYNLIEDCTKEARGGFAAQIYCE